MKIVRTLPFFLAVLSIAFADIEFTVPHASATISAGDVITAHWKETGYHPTLSELVQFNIYLCAGGDAPGSYVSRTLSFPVLCSLLTN